MRTSTPLLFLAGIVTLVSGLNLNELSAIPSDSVTPGCLSTYSLPIDKCPESTEFQPKASCSAECVDALTAQQKIVILACRQAFVSPNSLLRRLIDGGLVSTLCSSTSAPSSSAAASSTPASSAAAVSSTPVSSSSPTTAPASSTTRLAMSDLLTMTIARPPSSSDVPSELTIDDSAAPPPSSSDIPTPPTTSVPAESAAEDPAPKPTKTPITDYLNQDKNAAGRTGVAALMMVVLAAAAVVVA